MASHDSAVGQRQSDLRLADARGTFDDEVLRRFDPVAGDKPLEQRSVEAALGTPVDSSMVAR